MAKKTIIDAITTLYSKLGGNLSDVLGTRSNVNFMGVGKSSEPFLDMDLNIEALGAISKSKALQELKSSVGFATADKLNDVQANKLLTNMMKMDEFYNPRQVTNITDLATGTKDLDAQGLESLRTKVLPDEEKSVLMSRLDEIVKKKQGKRMLDEDEITELDIDVGGLDAYDFDGTLASANRIRKERADYIRDMELEYRKGNLDPAPGEANRETFLRRKFDEMEASGDKRLMTRDEIEELSAFENTSPIQKTLSMKQLNTTQDQRMLYKIL